MEKQYYYPNDNVIPVEVGDGYKDYLLSSLLPEYQIASIDGRVYRRVDSTILLNVVFVVKDSSGNFFWHEFYPLNYCPASIISQDLFLRATDIVIRIFEKNGNIDHPGEEVRWVKILSGKDITLELEDYTPINRCHSNPWYLSEVHDMSFAIHDVIANGNGMNRLSLL